MARSRKKDQPPDPVELTWAQVAAWRTNRQSLDQRSPKQSMVQVVGAMCGVQAQLMSSAELSVAARVDGITSDDVQAALWETRDLFKSWAMRGTLHLLPSAEYATWQAGWGTYTHYLKPSWFRAFGLTEKKLDQLVDAVSEALHDRCLTREQLGDEVTRTTGSEDLGHKLRESWGTVLKPASFRGRLCFAPNDGRNTCFTHPATWLGEQDAVEPDAALADITRRFLSAHGPATRDDLGRWWAVSPAAAAKLIAALGDDVVEVDVEGYRSWLLAEHVEAVQGATPSGVVRLLPSFDQYVLASTRHAEHLLPDPGFRDRVHRPQAQVSAVVLVDGRIDGVWSYDRDAKRLAVDVEPFAKPTPNVRKAVEAEAERVATFLDRPLDLTWVPPPGG